MTCTECQDLMVGYLEGVLSACEAQDVETHLHACPTCRVQATEYAQIRDRLTASAERFAQVPLDTRVMNQVCRERTVSARRIPMLRRYGLVRLAIPAAAACIALVVGIASLFYWKSNGPDALPTLSAYTLFAQACAAEEMLYPEADIVHLVNEIVVKPVSDPALARIRWLPVASLDATGQPRFHQLTLPAAPGEEYTVEDRAWYDSATGRFAHVLTAGDRPVFANAYDGHAVYSLEPGNDGAMQIKGNPVGEKFRSPMSPAEFLGIAAGLRGSFSADDDESIQDAGTSSLADGSAVRVLRACAGPPYPDGADTSCWLFRIRQDDGTIAEMEWFAGGESLLLVRRDKTEVAEAPGVAWNLAELQTCLAEASQPSSPAIVPDMVVPNVSVQDMIDRASFETYLFSANPSWTQERQITNILDILSPPDRMFSLAYRAKDGRHVVLVQSPSYNKLLGVMTRMPGAKLSYESGNGCKVWSGPEDRMAWLANTVLKSARSAIGDPPAERPTGCLLETPAETFPVLAINGQVTEEELHSLVDGLIPAREYKGE